VAIEFFAPTLRKTSTRSPQADENKQTRSLEPWENAKLHRLKMKWGNQGIRWLFCSKPALVSHCYLSGYDFNED